MADYDGGRVFLRVTPSFNNVQRLIDAEATRWGTRAGAQFRDSFERETGRTRVSPGPSGSESSRQGALSGGAYGDAFRQKLLAATRSLPPVRIGVATSQAEQDLRDLRRDLESLTTKRVGVDIDSEQAMAEVDRIQAELTRLAEESPDVQVRADTRAASAQLESLRAELRRLDGEESVIDVDLDVNDGDLAGRVRDALRRAQASLPRIEIDADTSDAEVEVARLRGRIEALSNKRIGVDISAEEAVAQIANLQERLARLSSESPDVRVTADAAAAAAALAEIQAQADRLNGRRVRVDVDSSGIDSFSGRLQLMGTLIGSLLPALVPIGGAAIVGIGAIGAASTASLPAIGALLLGLNGVGDALKAMAKVDDQASQTAQANAQKRAQAAASQESAARAVENAERSLANTRAQAEQAATRSARTISDAKQAEAKAEADAATANVDAARKVAEARQKVADVAESTARSVQSALRQQEDAERSLTAAQGDALSAQEDLTRAREDAREQLEDLAMQVESGALRQRQAVIDVADAQDELNKTLADPTASDRDKAQAQLRYDAAVQQLQELTVRNQRLRDEQTAANAAGVEGSDEVTAAQQRVADAVQNTQDAQQRAADAAQAVADARTQADRDSAEAQQGLTDALAAQEQARLDGLDRIASAQQAVADAVVASQEQQRQSTFSLQQAESSLESARAAGAAAAKSSSESASSAVTALATSMAALSPVQQEFVKFLYGLKPQVEALQAASARGLLPGAQAGIQALLPLLPELEQILGNVGGALGQLAQQAGQALASPQWRPFFDFLRDQGGPLLLQFGQIIGNLAVALIPGLVSAFGPLAGPVLSILQRLTAQFADFMTGLSSNPAFQSFTDYVKENAPILADTLGKVADAIVNIILSMAPMGPVILQVIGFFAQLIAAIPPGVLEAVALAVIGISAAFTILGPVIGFVSGIITEVGAGASILGAILAALGGPVTLVIAGIVALGAVLVACYQNSETFRDIVNAAFGAVRDFIVNVVWEQGLKPALQALVDFWQNVVAPAATWLWQNVLAPAFEGIGKAVVWAWQNVIKPALDALVWFWQNVLYPTTMWLWHNVFEPAFSAIGFIVQVAWAIIKLTLDAMIFYYKTIVWPVVQWLWHNVFEPAFKGIGDAASWVWNNVLRPVFDALGGFFRNTLGPAVSAGVDAFKAGWDAMRKAAADPINFVIREIYGGTDEAKGIRGLFTKVAKAVGSDARLPEVKEVAYATGGSVRGPGTGTSDDIPAWLSNGEHVWTAREVARAGGHRAVEALRNAALSGRLGDILPRFAKGGIVDLGHWFQSLGARPSEHPSFGGVHPVHKGRGHYEGRAIDVNYGPGGESDTEKAFFDKYAAALKAAGWTVFWRVPGHFNHLHAEEPTLTFQGQIPGTGGDLLGQAANAGLDALGAVAATISNRSKEIWDGAKSVAERVAAFVNPFDDVLAKLDDKILASPVAQLGVGATKNAGKLVKDWVTAKVRPMVESANKIDADGGMTGPIDDEYDGAQGSLSPAAARAAAKVMIPSGWSFSDLDKLWTKESGWSWSALNRGSGAYGIPQSLPGNKMASAGKDWRTNSVTQIKWGLGYIKDRYHNSDAAWKHSQANNWYAEGGPVKATLYDSGGWLKPGMTLVQNATGRPEPVFTGEQFDALSSRAMGQERLTPLLQRLIDITGTGNEIAGAGLARISGAVEDQPRRERQLVRQGVR